MESIVVISGPTGVGKTAVAVDLALRIDAELVGADSMQVYRGADIGTAKPTSEDLKGVAHHMLDVVEPGQEFNAAEYSALAREAITDIRSRGRNVIVVGGSGLYLRALLYGLVKAPAAHPDVRREIRKEAEAKGWDEMHRLLAEADPETASRLDPNDTVRITRALEVFRISGSPISRLHQVHGFRTPEFKTHALALHLPKEKLRERIDERIDRMMARGFLDEVETLLQKGLRPSRPPLNGIGYHRLCQHLSGQLTLEQAVARIKTDTARYAKRQMTWLRGEKDWTWSRPDLEEVLRMLNALNSA